MVGARPADALAEQPDQRLGRWRPSPRSARRGPARPGCGRGGAGGRGPRRSTSARLRRSSGWANQRNTHAAGQVADTAGKRTWVASDQVLQREPGALAQRLRAGGGSASHCRSSADDDRDVGRRPLLGQEDPEDRLLQLGRALEVGDAVVGEHPGEPVRNVSGRPAAVDVEALQVACGSTRAGCAPGCLGSALLAAGRLRLSSDRSANTRQQVHLGLERRLASRQLGPRGQVAGQHPALVAAGRRRSRAAGCAGPRRPRATRSAADASDRLGGQVQLDGLGVGGLLGRGLVGERLQAQQRRAGLDLAADRHRALADPGPERRAQHRLHLHALQHQHRRARLDLVADLQRRRDDQRGRGGAHDAALVAADPVGDAVDLDQVDRPVGVGDAAGTRCPLTTIRPVCSSKRSSSTSTVCTAPPPPMPTRNRCGPIRATRHPVADAAQLEVERPAALVLHLRAAAVRGGQQPLPLDLLLVLVRLDRGRGQGDRRSAGG